MYKNPHSIRRATRCVHMDGLLANMDMHRPVGGPMLLGRQGYLALKKPLPP